MKNEFNHYCQAKNISVVRLDDQGCDLDLPRSAAHISEFLADSPVPTPSGIDLFAGLAHLVDKDGLKVLEFDNWKLSAQPEGGIPPAGGMLRLTVKF